MPPKRKQDVITFKVDAPLRVALMGIPNRSEFIRAAVLSALESICPLCKGSGILTPDQRRHWNRFASDHRLQQCAECDAVHLVCEARRSAESHRGTSGDQTADQEERP